MKDSIFETAQDKCRCFFGGTRRATFLRRLYQIKRLFSCNEKFLPPRVGTKISDTLCEPPAENLFLRLVIDEDDFLLFCPAIGHMFSSPGEKPPREKDLLLPGLPSGGRELK